MNFPQSKLVITAVLLAIICIAYPSLRTWSRQQELTKATPSERVAPQREPSRKPEPIRVPWRPDIYIPRWDRELSVGCKEPTIPLRLQRVQAQTGIGPGDPTGQTMLLAPLMIFDRRSDGSVAATVHDDGSMVIPVITYDPTKSIESAAYIKLDGTRRAAEYERGGTVLTLEPIKVQFWTRFGFEGASKFEEWNGGNLATPSGRVNLVGRLSSKAAAERFVQALSDGRAQIEAAMVYPNARFTEGFVSLSLSDVESTNSYRDLRGRGAAPVTRREIARLATEALRHAAITIVRDEDLDTDLDFAKLVNQLLSVFDKQEGQRIPTNRKNLREAFAAVGIDPDDFKADLLRRFKERYSDKGDQFDLLQREVDRQFSADSDSKGKAGFLDIVSLESAVSGVVSRRDIEKTLEESSKSWDLTYEYEGNDRRFVPKSIKLYRLNEERFKDVAYFSYGDRKRIFGEGVLRATLSNHTAFSDFDIFVRDLRQQVATYLSRLAEWDRIADPDVEYDQRLTEYRVKHNAWVDTKATLDRADGLLTGVGRDWTLAPDHKQASFDLPPRHASYRYDADEHIRCIVTYYGRRPDNIAVIVEGPNGRRESPRIMPGGGGGRREERCLSGKDVINGVVRYYEGRDFDGWTFTTTSGQLDARLGGGPNPKAFSLPSLPEGFEWEICGVTARGGGGWLASADFRFRVIFRDRSRELGPEPIPPTRKDRPRFPC